MFARALNETYQYISFIDKSHNQIFVACPRLIQTKKLIFIFYFVIGSDSNTRMADDGYKSDSSDGSDHEIKITLTKRDFSKMTPEELIEYDRKMEEQNMVCAYCISLGKEAEGHTKDNCKLLQNTRCNWCGNYGHTGKFCENKGEKPLDIRCLFCFRGKKDERFYMSHSIDNCRFRREYEQTRPPQYRPRPSYNNKPPTPHHRLEQKTSTLDEDGLNLVRRFPLPEKNETKTESEPTNTQRVQKHDEPTERDRETHTHEQHQEKIDPLLQALIFFDQEMKKSQPPKMYEPTSPQPITEKEYLMILRQRNQMMLGKLRAIKK